ncbi:MAG TPA: DASS family sodium-coupled anion symporter [Pyrinomonadaceae bacterium]
MDEEAHPLVEPANAVEEQRPRDGLRRQLLKWAVVILSALVVAFIPVPSGITPQAWRLLAIFVATIIGSIVRPVPGGAMVLLGVSAAAISGALTIESALKGYADPIVWLVLAAFMISRGMIKTGLGRRIALVFVRAIGHRTLGLGYALVTTDMLLASVIPSNGARAGGIIFPVAKSISETYESKPGASARRLGAYLMTLIYQCDVIVCAMFLTGQASNALIAKFAKEVTGFELSYPRWLLGAIVPGIVSLLIVPLLIYRLYPPEIKHTPEAARYAADELKKMGRMSLNEKLMLLVFALVAALWMTTWLHNLNYAVIALLGICVLLLSGVLEWSDVVSERAAWDVFIWYGGLVRLAEALGETGITKRFAEAAASLTSGWMWWAALAALLLIYFYAHYAFASITAHATAMYIPFLVVIIAAGAPATLAVLSLAYFSNLNASLTHYGTTPAPIYFGAGYVRQRTWWWIGLIVSVPNILIWTGIGFGWWKLLGWW